MFSKDKVNTVRQCEIDISRGLAILFMIFIHVQLYFADSTVLNSSFGDFNDFVGDIPAAPVFMFLLGIGINYSKKNSPKLMFKRGLYLVLGAYALNLVRGFIPNMINAYYLEDISYLYEAFSELVYIDILQFSGLAMIMFSIFSKLKLKKSSIISIGVLLSLLNILLVNFKVDNLLIASITGLFWGSNSISYFPFLTWAFYPIAGFIFGSYLIRCTNTKKFYIISTISSAIVLIVTIILFNIILGFKTGLETDYGYYHHIITDNIIFTAYVILEISILSFIVPIVPKFLLKIISRWSKNVTPIYFIHWVIITWLALIIPQNSLSLVNFTLILLIIIISTDLLSIAYGKFTFKRKQVI